MPRFFAGHAAHAQAISALAMAAQQIEARAEGSDFKATLALLYITDHYAADAEQLLAGVRQRWPGVCVAGCVGVGVCASGVEYFDQPALALLLCDLPVDSFAVFSGRAPLRDDSWAALVHADPATPDLAELIGELAQRTESHYLFGGLASSRSRTLGFADGVFEGGLSGVAFTRAVALVSRVTQGCQPVGPQRRITGAQGNVVTLLDQQSALPLLLADLGVDLDQPAQAVHKLRATLAGLTDAGDDALARGGQFGADTRVRHLVGIDPARKAIAVADRVEPGMQLTFCSRDAGAARSDLVRICTEIRDQVEASAGVGARAWASGTPGSPGPRGCAGPQIAGAIYVSCTGRGGAHFGAPSAELQIVRRALGDVPLAGFFAAGEIARRHLYGYTGVLTVFVED
jgi:small ligand-binding sensory domain FIST